MNRAVFAFTLAGWVGLSAIAVQGRAPAQEVFLREVQAAGQAWQFSGVDLPEGYEAAISAKGMWTTHPREGAVGAGGGEIDPGDKFYVKNGAAHGCLLVRTGDKVLSFSKDDQVVHIETPGPIYFCANDARTQEGARRSRGYINSLPIPGMTNRGVGFTDNRGELLVRIVVKKLD
jgi:hypothetical protein